MMAKRIALVQPGGKPKKSMMDRLPIRLHGIAAQLKRAGYVVKIFHNNLRPLLEDIRGFKPDHVGITSMSNTHLDAEIIAREAEQLGATVTYGGWHVSGCAVSYMKGMESETLTEILNPNSPFNYIVVGEGELAYLELLRALDRNVGLEEIGKISGVGFSTNEGIVLSRPERIMDLDSLPFLPSDELEIERYVRDDWSCLDIHTQRACRFSCGYCATPVVYPGKITRKSPKKVVDQIEEQLSSHQTMVVFIDEDFLSDLKWVRELMEEIIRRKIPKKKVHFEGFASVYDLHLIEKNGEENILELMEEANFKLLQIGVESFTASTLRDYGKVGRIRSMMTTEERRTYNGASQNEKDRLLVSVYLDRIQRAVNLLGRYGIVCDCDYIVGYPKESMKETAEGFKLFMNIENLLHTFIPIFVAIPGTALWKEIYESGKLRRRENGGIDWDSFDVHTGCLDLGYDVRGLRDQLEIRFYTSGRYLGDMNKALATNPLNLGFFLSRFKSLHESHPNSRFIEVVYSILDGTTGKERVFDFMKQYQ